MGLELCFQIISRITTNVASRAPTSVAIAIVFVRRSAARSAMNRLLSSGAASGSEGTLCAISSAPAWIVLTVRAYRVKSGCSENIGHLLSRFAGPADCNAKVLWMTAKAAHHAAVQQQADVRLGRIVVDGDDAMWPGSLDRLTENDRVADGHVEKSGVPAWQSRNDFGDRPHAVGEFDGTTGRDGVSVGNFERGSRQAPLRNAREQEGSPARGGVLPMARGEKAVECRRERSEE